MNAPSLEPEWLATSEEIGGRIFRVGRLGQEEVIAEWIGVAKLIARRDGREHRVVFEEGVPLNEQRKLTHGGVNILLHQLTGGLSVHGSAVVVGESALVFLGGSGFGKSTLAAALCDRRGAMLLADDAVALHVETDSATVLPTEGDHWLDAQARNALSFATPAFPLTEHDSKIPIPARLPAPTSARIAALVCLAWSERDEEQELSEMSGVDAVACVLPHLARFIMDSASHQRRELETLENLVTHTRVFQLTRPQRFDRLDASIDILAELCLKRKQ